MVGQSYTVSPTELSPNGEHPPIYFPGITRTGGKDGLLLRFTASDGKQWSGCFAFGDYELCGIFALPDPGCVAAGAYLADLFQVFSKVFVPDKIFSRDGTTGKVHLVDSLQWRRSSVIST
jgi:hypothetical protein